MEKKPLLYPPWGILEALMVLVLVNFVAFMFRKYGGDAFLFLLGFLPQGNSQLNQLLLSSIIQTSLFLVFIYFFARIVNDAGLKNLGFVQRRGFYWLAIGLLNGVILFFGVTALGILIKIFLPLEIDPQPITEVILLAQSSWERLIPFLVTVVLAPISEEIYFRAFLYPALRNKIGVTAGIFLTSLIFAGLHYDPVRMIPLVFGGIWLNWLYERSGTIYTSMIAHSAWNGIMCILLLYPLPKA